MNNSISSSLRTRASAVVLAVAALLVLSLGATGAQAARTKVTGGTTMVTPTPQVVEAFKAAGVTVAPIAPATASGATFTFPVVRGWVNAKNLHAKLVHRGGLKFTRGDKSVAVRRLVVVSGRRGARLFAHVPSRLCRRAVAHHRAHQGKKGNRAHPARRGKLARRACRIGYLPVARLVDAKRSDDGKTVTATLKLTSITARLVNRLAGKTVAKAGVVLGTATITPTTA